MPFYNFQRRLVTLSAHRNYDLVVNDIFVIAMHPAFCVDLGDGSFWSSTSFIPEKPTLVQLGTDASACAHFPISQSIDAVHFSPPHPLSALSGDSVLQAPTATVANNFGASATTNIDQTISSDTWTDAYMDGWIFSQCPEAMIRADCVALLSACGGEVTSSTKQPTCEHDQPAGNIAPIRSRLSLLTR